MSKTRLCPVGRNKSIRSRHKGSCSGFFYDLLNIKYNTFGAFIIFGTWGFWKQYRTTVRLSLWKMDMIKHSCATCCKANIQENGYFPSEQLAGNCHGNICGNSGEDSRPRLTKTSDCNSQVKGNLGLEKATTDTENGSWLFRVIP